jgi:hypothetical protein
VGDSDTWRKYGIALLLVTFVGVISAIPDLDLPSPQDPGWTPLIGLLQAVIAGVGFSLIVFIATAWSRKSGTDDTRSRLRKAVYVFLIVGGGEFVLDLSTRIFLYGHANRTELQRILAQIVEAGRGYLLPLFFLALFIAFMFWKTRRSH